MDSPVVGDFCTIANDCIMKLTFYDAMNDFYEYNTKIVNKIKNTTVLYLQRNPQSNQRCFCYDSDTQSIQSTL